MILFFLLSTALAQTQLPQTLPPKMEPVPQSTFELEWEIVEEAESYEVKLTPKNGQPPLLFTTKEPRIVKSIPSGVYTLQIRSKESGTGYMGSWSDPAEIEVASKTVQLLAPKDHEVIAEAKSKRRIITFEWTPVAGAKNYTLKIWEDDPAKAKEFTTSKNTKQLDLPAGRTYHWQVTLEDEKSIRYQAAVHTNSFSILGEQLIKPVINPKIVGNRITRWSESPGADRYHAVVWQRYLDETEWKKLYEGPDIKALRYGFQKLKPGAYKIEVTAHAKHRVSSETAEYEFIVKPTELEFNQLMRSALVETELDL